MNSEPAAGVRKRLLRTVASQDLTIWQNEVSINDFSDPRLSGQMAWVAYLRNDLIWRARPAGHLAWIQTNQYAPPVATRPISLCLPDPITYPHTPWGRRHRAASIGRGVSIRHWAGW
jgi:hypothetical protein